MHAHYPGFKGNAVSKEANPFIEWIRLFFFNFSIVILSMRKASFHGYSLFLFINSAGINEESLMRQIRQISCDSITINDRWVSDNAAQLLTRGAFSGDFYD